MLGPSLSFFVLCASSFCWVQGRPVWQFDRTKREADALSLEHVGEIVFAKRSPPTGIRLFGVHIEPSAATPSSSAGPLVQSSGHASHLNLLSSSNTQALEQGTFQSDSNNSHASGHAPFNPVTTSGKDKEGASLKEATQKDSRAVARRKGPQTKFLPSFYHEANARTKGIEAEIGPSGAQTIGEQLKQPKAGRKRGRNEVEKDKGVQNTATSTSAGSTPATNQSSRRGPGRPRIDVDDPIEQEKLDGHRQASLKYYRSLTAFEKRRKADNVARAARERRSRETLAQTVARREKRRLRDGRRESKVQRVQYKQPHRTKKAKGASSSMAAQQGQR
jgi:hypothetical protein